MLWPGFSPYTGGIKPRLAILVFLVSSLTAEPIF